ncbi:hypothetical protein EMIHUDRAFT_353495 [Emiliania huxleyi CCMP1516]|uniref:CBP/p300-type HAT domain-containing protein n=3 Tax=Emiliania huxleyi TaxID=2903 RepID=A0A0D3JYF0_EMIH1|nr:hypothetical protein EMIHUDRAFT_353495 [Emiliania huxleyi CCMP1516]EOD28535.1 hypothetical protein EMIHUDRAFT_353495 [Emiliania huxleyi CCMP1516]|eukprot:XP_005780964.1 hypothetical protein EMIHUDRAFT_353495 [Emiliania huxleyi CCMP1516]
MAIADEMKAEVHGAAYSFLVASLATAEEPIQPPREPDIGPRELVDDREHFHEMCVSRHWQSDELYRAHWSTMMLLAVLGGPPD